MSSTGSLAAPQIEPKMGPKMGFWTRADTLGLVVGLSGGMVQSLALGTPVTHGVVIGGLFGLIFAIFFAQRATSAGAGLIWGLAAAFLMWLVIPAGLEPLFSSGSHSMAMLSDTRDQFPLLVAYLECLGMPVGLVLGIRGRSPREISGDSFPLGTSHGGGGLRGLAGRFYF